MRTKYFTLAEKRRARNERLKRKREQDEEYRMRQRMKSAVYYKKRSKQGSALQPTTSVDESVNQISFQEVTPETPTEIEKSLQTTSTTAVNQISLQEEVSEATPVTSTEVQKPSPTTSDCLTFIVNTIVAEGPPKRKTLPKPNASTSSESVAISVVPSEVPNSSPSLPNERAQEIAETIKRPSRTFSSFRNFPKRRRRVISDKPSTRSSRIGSLVDRINVLKEDSGANGILLLRFPNTSTASNVIQGFGDKAEEALKSEEFQTFYQKWKHIFDEPVQKAPNDDEPDDEPPDAIEIDNDVEENDSHIDLSNVSGTIVEVSDGEVLVIDESFTASNDKMKTIHIPLTKEMKENLSKANCCSLPDLIVFMQNKKNSSTS